jgi:hypothetical protein
MGFGVNLGGLWRPKNGGKSICSGQFNLPAALTLDAARGHRFVVTARKKMKQSEPDFDLWLFARDEDGSGGFDAPTDTLDQVGNADEVPF